GLDPGNPVIHRLLHLADELQGFPRHLSQHVGGFVIARGPLCRLVPIENAAMPERTVIQWDKDDLDAMGLLKVDCLGLGMLSAIRRAFDLIYKRRGRRLTLADVPAEDPNVYDMIRRADVMGVFQVESRAQMAMLPRLRPEIFYDLVIEVAIVRPGPIQGDMVHPYLRRRQGLEPVTYPSDDVRSVLERTLGVPIFQEQAIKLAMVAAGFSAGEADQLRRAIGSWRRRTRLAPLQQRLLEGMRARGYDEGFARRVFNQIQGFGEYGFPESHAASFALLVYVSAWLKHHEPAAFTCALLNSQPMGFYAPAQLVQDPRRHGVEVRPVDVLHSDWDCTLEPGGGSERKAQSRKTQRKAAKVQSAQRCLNPKSFSASRVMGDRTSCTHRRSCAANSEDVNRRDRQLNSFATFASSRLCVGPAQPLALRLGLRMVKGLTRAGGERLAQARREGAFTDAQDLARQARLSRGDLEALAAAGALAPLTGDRHRARWEVLGTEPTLPLFTEASIRETSPSLPKPTEGQDLIADYASTGLTLGRHPLALLRGRLERLGYPPASCVQTLEDRTAVRYAGVVITRQRPSSAAGVTFLTLEDETGVINVIVWENVMERCRKAVLGAQLLGVIGTLQREGEVQHVVARRLEDHSRLLGGLVTHSRDFC
nr:error-prone DNA polymerase [Gammaproteobacteria bacterium]NIR28440.1 error-prone DNA polymerase [Gammaproteobacteria bacterium]NIR96886.1 error-prone DNA polymerase [Gammaproteobacteria bacterium]NIT62587.1 error-prone DNA polymerase [Gammaproteobacteria bacterium]NIV19544.1 error-prone DNA polymerase [Gammaproteobacteria bacterium]